MKVITLYENTCCRDDVICGHGLSQYIETAHHRILLDMGRNGDFIANAETLGVDLAAVDIAVLSHGHNDHSGGLQYLVDRNRKLPLLCHPETFAYREDEEGLPIGSPLEIDEVKKSYRPEYSRKPVQISEHLFYLGQIEEHVPFERRYAIGRKKDGGTMKADFIFDDSALAYKGRDGIFIITGCSHSGICNIIEQAKTVLNDDRVIGVIGGFHLFNIDERLEKTIAYLKENRISRLYPCHCVSLAAKITMAGDLAIQEVGVGMVLDID